MATFEQAYENVAKLHAFYLGSISTPLIPQVFNNSVNHYGFSVSHMLSRFWKDPARFAKPTFIADLYHEGEAVILPSHLGAALLLHPNRTTAEISYIWNSVPELAVLAFASLNEPALTTKVGLLESSIVEWLGKGGQAASHEIVTARKAKCLECPSWSPKGYLGLGKCTKCGCSVAKLYMSTSKCLLGKW